MNASPLDLHELAKACNEVPESSILVPSPYDAILNPSERITRIAADFNRHVKEPVITGAGARAGVRVQPGFFYCVHRNKVPEIAVGVGNRLVMKLTAGYTETGPLCSEDGRVKQTEPVIGDYGVYIVNVPQGHLAKVWSGNTPKLLNAGSHVIHDNLFRVNNPLDESLPQSNDPGSAGEAASLTQPITNTSLDRMGFVNINDVRFLVDSAHPVIEHGILRIVRVPQGSLAKVFVESEAFLLPYRQKGPYCFSTPFFNFCGFVPESAPHISFGNLHLIRVPAGSVAKAWLGSKPLLLEYRDAPYYFADATFRIHIEDPTLFAALILSLSLKRDEAMSMLPAAAIFHASNARLITHGTISRMWPGVTGNFEAGVIKIDNQLQIVEKFVTIDNPGHSVVGFVDKGIQTFSFPSSRTRLERLSEGQINRTEQQYEIMTTRDSLKLAVKLVVAIQIVDPTVTLRKLRLDGVEHHIEKLTVSDMVRAVQGATAQTFLGGVVGRNTTSSSSGGGDANQSLTDVVCKDIALHLQDCGIALVRFSIEEAKVLNESIAAEMAKQSLVSAAANGEQALIMQRAAVARSHAEVEAMQRQVQQEQTNALIISSAAAQLEATKLHAAASIATAEAQARLMEIQGRVYREYPELLQIEITRLQTEALKQCQIVVCADSLQQMQLQQQQEATLVQLLEQVKQYNSNISR